MRLRMVQSLMVRTLVRMLHFRARKAFLNPEKQRLREVWQLTIERAAGEATYLGTSQVSIQAKKMGKYLEIKKEQEERRVKGWFMMTIVWA